MGEHGGKDRDGVLFLRVSVIYQEKGQADPKYAENVFEDWTDATGPDKNGWYFLGSKKDVWGGSGVSVGKDFAGYQNNTSKGFPSLKNFSEDIRLRAQTEVHI